MYVCYLAFIHSFILVEDDGRLLTSKPSNIRLYLVLRSTRVYIYMTMSTYDLKYEIF